MQLDKARITIRERSFLEILDLGLRLIQGHPATLLLFWALGVAPFLLLNDVLFNQQILVDVPRDLGYVDPQDMQELITGYCFAQVVIFIEAPFATSLITIFLGQILFVKSPDLRNVASGFFQCLGQLVLLLIVVRVVAFLMCFFPLFLLYWLMPFTPEVIVLERASVSKTWNRLGGIRKGFHDTLFVRGLMALVFGALCVVSVWTSLTFLQSVIIDQYSFAAITLSLRWLVPISIWIVVGYFAVVRFLSYLDLRIRKEGWDVELQMRAEGARLEENIVT